MNPLTTETTLYGYMYLMVHNSFRFRAGLTVDRLGGFSGAAGFPFFLFFLFFWMMLMALRLKVRSQKATGFVLFSFLFHFFSSGGTLLGIGVF